MTRYGLILSVVMILFAKPALAQDKCVGVDLSVWSEELVACAEQGSAEAQSKLGYMYDYGQGVPEDNEEAIRWYTLAAEQGQANAQFNLGFMYYLGSGIPEDGAEAARWFKLAAEQEDAYAQYLLGALYDEGGPNLPVDYGEAARWYHRAAEQGETTAQYALGLLYSVGRGVPQDLVYAYMWWNVATFLGDSWAGKRDKIAESMTVEQIAEAERLTREWLEAHSELEAVY